MFKEKIQFFLLCLAVGFLLFPAIVNAQDPEAQAEVDAIRDATFIPQDFNIPVATMAPDNLFYPLKNFFREIRIRLTFDTYTSWRRRIETVLEHFGEIELLLANYDNRNLLHVEQLFRYIDSDMQDISGKIVSLSDDEKKLAYLDVMNMYYTIQTGLDNAEIRAAGHERLLLLSLRAKNNIAQATGEMISNFSNSTELFNAANNTLSARNSVSGIGELVRWGYVLRLALHSDIARDYIEDKQDEAMLRLGDVLRDSSSEYVDVYFRYARIDPELLLQWIFAYNSQVDSIPDEIFEFEKKLKALVIKRYYDNKSHAIRDTVIASFDRRDQESLTVFLLWLSDDVTTAEKHFLVDAYNFHKRALVHQQRDARGLDLLTIRALFEDVPAEVSVLFKRTLSVFDLAFATEAGIGIPPLALDTFLLDLEAKADAFGEDKILFENIQDYINANENLKSALVEYAGDRVLRLLVSKELQDLDKSNRLRENTNFRL